MLVPADFVVYTEGGVVLVEVKSGSRISGGSLASYKNKYEPRVSVRLSMNNLQCNGNLLSIPLPLADQLYKYIHLYFSEYNDRRR